MELRLPRRELAVYPRSNRKIAVRIAVILTLAYGIPLAVWIVPLHHSAAPEVSVVFTGIVVGVTLYRRVRR